MRRRPSGALAWSALAGAALTAAPALAEGADPGEGPQPAGSIAALAMFAALVVVTLLITVLAARRTRSAADFPAACGAVTGLQNGLAIAGDYMSAASFLGISALIYASGYDGLIYAVGFLAGWPIIATLLVERLRNLGKYTFADVLSARLAPVPVRCLAAAGTLAVVVLYLTAQMVGAGQLIALLFRLDYTVAELLVGALMVLFVTFGGMLAAVRVQIVKACLLLGGATLMAVLVLARFGFDPAALLARAVEVHPSHDAILLPGAIAGDPVEAVSLGLALLFGAAGLPHILMRFFTVADATEARKSVVWATSFLGYFYILTFVIGFGAIALVSADPADLSGPIGSGLRGGDNMAAVWLAQAVGGDLLLGFVSAVTFGAILAVVSGLTLAGAAAVSHDLYAGVFRRGRVNERAELRVSRLTTLLLGGLAVGLGIAFERQNIAVLVGLAFAIAASANFPVLILSLYWRGMTTLGAVVGGWLGLVSAVGLTVLGPTIWVGVLGHPAGSAPFPFDAPALFSVPAAFAGVWLFSVLDRTRRAEAERGRFEAQYISSQTGIAAR